MSQRRDQTGALLRLAEPPELHRANRPGLSSLRYRAGTYLDLLQAMLEHLNSVVIPDGPYQGQQPLRNLHMHSDHDLVLALLRAWATVGDVLSFYQERIINEGYLRTATEQRSVLELVRMLNYQPKPALAAATHLAFTLLNAQGAPTRVTVPQGTQVQSMPNPGQFPVVFETSEPLEADVAWNALPVRIPQRLCPQTFGAGTTELRIKEVLPGFKIGSVVLIADEPAPAAAGPFPHYLRTISRVEVNRTKRYTLLGWDEPLAGDQALRQPQAWLLRQRANLFGHHARPWASLPTAKRQQAVVLQGGVLRSDTGGATWLPASSGLPEATVHALLHTQAGSLFAGTAKDMFCSTDGGNTWLPTPTRKLARDIRCLTVSPRGQIFAGSASGEVFRSTDGGSTWEALPGGVRMVAEGKSWRPVNARLPKTVIRALVTLMRDGQITLLAGTDKGVVRSADAGTAWEPSNQGLPGYDSASGLASTVITALLAGERPNEVFAGTAHGVYMSSNGGASWSFRSDGLPGLPDDYPIFTARVPGARMVVTLSGPPDAPPVTGIRALASFSHPHTRHLHLLAGTDQGLFHSTDRGATWMPLGQEALIDAQGQPLAVDVLAVGHDPTSRQPWLLAGTANGLFGSADQGQTWQQLQPDPILALTAHAAQQVWVATPQTRRNVDEWPNFQISPGQLDLDGVYPQLEQSLWAVLHQSHPTALSVLYRTRQIGAVAREGFGRRATVTRLQTPPDPILNQFDLRQASVLFESEALQLYVEQQSQASPLQGSLIQIPGALRNLPVGRLIAVSGKHSAVRLLGEIGGVWWQRAEGWSYSGPADQAGTALALDPRGHLLLACGPDLLCWDAPEWVVVAQAPHPLTALAIDQQGQICAGTAQGVLYLSQQGWQPEPGNREAIQSLLALADHSLVAGTASGMMRRVGQGWQPDGLVGVRVDALLQQPDGRVYAGTDQGVFQHDGQAWQELGTLLRPTFALVWDSQFGLVAGTSDGLYRWSGQQWEPFGLQGTLVQALQTDPEHTLYAGTHGQGLWQRSAHSAEWVPQPLGLSNDVRALICDPHGKVLAATNNQVLLTAPDGRVQAALPSRRLGVLDLAQINCLDQGYLSADLHTALARYHLAPDRDSTIRTLRSGACWLLHAGKIGELLLRQCPEGLVIYGSALLELLEAPTALAGSTALRWNLQTADGVSGLLLAHPDALGLEAAPESWATHAEIAQVASVELDPAREYTTLGLSQPLRGCYDPHSVGVCANVVHATHGETVPLDVLGSGDHRQANQRFMLHKDPLTYLAAPTPAGFASTLQIRVRSGPATPLTVSTTSRVPSGILWHPTDTLSSAHPRDRVYSLRSESNARTSVVFGDGQQGARLPTGSENIVATYRTGSGPAGNLEPNRLTLLKSRPTGVRRVTNPVLASGGSPAEDPTSMRRAAPLRTRSSGRIVSLRDFEDFSRAFAGVAKACAQHLQTPDGPLVLLTLAGLDGAVIDPQSDLYAELQTAICRARPVPHPLRICSYLRAAIQLTARLQIHPDCQSEDIRRAALQRLVPALLFEQRDFRQPISAALLTSQLQQLPGVIAVRLEELHRRGWSRALHTLLEPGLARYQRQVVLPAEILLIDGPEDITLQIDTRL